MARRNSIIALLTDFGQKDHYVGTIKGVILSINPSAHIVDISHNVDPGNAFQAGYLLWASYKYFPTKTIFVCVVDPGVGSGRKILGIRTSKYIFLAPDNGLLNFMLHEEHLKETVRVDLESAKKQHLTLPLISSTFHGRDVFAPFAAHLSLGISLSLIGKQIKLAKPLPSFVNGHAKLARVLHVDSFGNIITNIQAQTPGEFGVTAGRKNIRRWIGNYTEAPEGKPCLITGSSGLVEIVVKNGSAARTLGVSSGERIRIDSLTRFFH